ncbi:MAG: SemiSWEET transporter [Methylococcaceae bacterium]|jgi:MtN3 and saliva related transmembrane protein|nr:SemiSWEET transporter [Methylococcaceae bacterium]
MAKLSMETTDLVGSLAGTLTTVSFIPQVIKTWRSQSASDISFSMFLLFSLGVLLWLIYGASIHSLPIVLANGITLALSLSIIAMKLWFERHLP